MTADPTRELAALLHPWLDQTPNCPWWPRTLCHNQRWALGLAEAVVAAGWSPPADANAPGLREAVEGNDPHSACGFAWAMHHCPEAAWLAAHDVRTRAEHGERIAQAIGSTPLPATDEARSDEFLNGVLWAKQIARETGRNDG